MKDLEKDLLEFCSNILYKRTNFEDLEDMHWVSFGHSNGEIYCYSCCDKEVDRINKEIDTIDEYDKAFVDGGWGGQDEDGSCYCETCNKKLDCSLTKYGVESEIEHFIENKLTKIDNETAIDLYYLFESSLNYNPEERYLKELLNLANLVLDIFGEKMGFESRFEILDL